jgi:hypothetical protein
MEKDTPTMKLRQFWKAIMWWNKGRAHHPYFRKITLDTISDVEIIRGMKHERTMKRRKEGAV